MTKHSEKKHNNKDVSCISLILPNKMLAILTEEAREMAAADGHNPNDGVGMMNYVSQIVANILETTYNNDFEILKASEEAKKSIAGVPIWEI